MYLFGADRHELIKYLPRNAVVAEIGVATGDFSERILTVCQPKELHLIDPWQHQEPGEKNLSAGGRQFLERRAENHSIL